MSAHTVIVGKEHQPKNHIKELRRQRADELKPVLQLFFIFSYHDKAVISFSCLNSNSNSATKYLSRLSNQGCKTCNITGVVR